MRHFLFDTAEYLRFSALKTSTFQPLAKLAHKITSEIKYHVYHGKTWVAQLGGAGSEESKARMQQALITAWPYALGMFEPGTDEQATYRIWNFYWRRGFVRAMAY